MSALPPKADMCGATRDVRFGPKADSCTAANSISIRSPRRRWRAAQPAVGGQALCGLEVDDQFELRRLFPRQICRRRSPDNMVYKVGGTEMAAAEAFPVTY